MVRFLGLLRAKAPANVRVSKRMTYLTKDVHLHVSPNQGEVAVIALVSEDVATYGGTAHKIFGLLYTCAMSAGDVT